MSKDWLTGKGNGKVKKDEEKDGTEWDCKRLPLIVVYFVV